MKDTAEGVVIKSILGEESYPRYKVHKIMYQKK